MSALSLVVFACESRTPPPSAAEERAAPEHESSHEKRTARAADPQRNGAGSESATRTAQRGPARATEASDEPGSSAAADPTTDPRPNDRSEPREWAVSAPRVIGTLVGPGARYTRDDLQLYGSEFGYSFEHAGALRLMFGDAWSDRTRCHASAADLASDSASEAGPFALATLPAERAEGMPALEFAIRADDPTALRSVQLFRDGDEVPLDAWKRALTGFSDGHDAYAIFQVQATLPCDPNDGPAACPSQAGVVCADAVLSCRQAPVSAPLACERPAANCQGADCSPPVAARCVDTRSAQFDGSARGYAASVISQLEIAKARSSEPLAYDALARWPTHAFSHPTARTVAKFSGRREGSDYGPGSDTLLIWGRPGQIAEQGRQAPLYLATQTLPFGSPGQPDFQPRYFAGLEPLSGEPRWSDDPARAEPLALDGVRGGDPYEPRAFVGAASIAWLGAPVKRWVMLYGGDTDDARLADPIGSRPQAAPGSIMLRFAEHPWGPWSPAIAHLSPGSPAQAGSARGPGGILFDPACEDGADPEQRCAPQNPYSRANATSGARCQASAQTEAGRLYAPGILETYTRANARGGLDLSWVVSTWNPHTVQLLETSIEPRAAPAADDDVADARALERLGRWRSLPELNGSEHYVQQTSRDRGVRDDDVALSYEGNRDYNNFICKSDDATISSRQGAPLHYDLPSCSEDYVRGAMLARFEGRGRFVRSWISMESLLYGPADDEILRIYVDDAPEPLIEVPLAAAIDGSAGEIFAPPFGVGSPRRLAWYYPISFERKLIVALDNLGEDDTYYYHVDAALERERPTLPRAFSFQPTDRDQAREQLGRVFSPAGTHDPLFPSERIALGPGESRRIELAGPATVHELRVRVAEAQLADLSAVRARAHWDFDSDAAIDLPLSDLFGGSDVPPDRSNLALTSSLAPDGRTLSLHLPMPFVTHAIWTFENTGSEAIEFELRMLGEPWLPRGVFGHLHAQYRETLSPANSQPPIREHIAASARGRGRLVGVCGRIEGHGDTDFDVYYSALNFLEGDVRARADGALALDGTGTEEYADDMFYFTDAPFASPFAQAWGIREGTTTGEVNLCRWHVLGTELDFESSFELSFELGGAGNPDTVDRIQTVAFMYLLPGP